MFHVEQIKIGHKQNLKTMIKGTEVTVKIPFTYTIGEEGFHTGKILESIQDCYDEVRAEIEAGVLNEDEVFIEVDSIN